MARYVNYHDLPPPPRADPERELVKSLTKLVMSSLPQGHYNKHELHGFYSGPTSIAYLFFRLSLSRPDLEVAGRRPREWCDTYLRHRVHDEPVTPNRCGIASETLSHLALSIVTTSSGARDRFSAFLSHTSTVLSTPPSSSRRPASDEWLYGRAGTLYLLCLIRHFVSPDTGLFSSIDQSISAVSAKITSEGPDWRWHGKRYLGAVHGSVGILTQIILSSSVLQQPPPRACWKWLRDILDLQFESGNWPSSSGSSAKRDELVQFCHGAPGFVISLLAVRKVIVAMEADAMANTHTSTELTGEAGEENEVNIRELCQDIDTAISKARTCIKQRGVLTKEPCLCHGVTGNALALEGEERKAMMDWTQESVISGSLENGGYVKGDDPAGLFCGEAGRAWGWLVMAGWGEGMIGFSDV